MVTSCRLVHNENKNHEVISMHMQLITNETGQYLVAPFPNRDDVKHQNEQKSKREMWLLSCNHICSFGLCISCILSIHYADQQEAGHRQTIRHSSPCKHKHTLQNVHTHTQYADTCKEKRGRLLIN